jgi:hypothetical protein
MNWIYDTELKFKAPGVQRRMYDGRIFVAEYDREAGIMYYNYTRGWPTLNDNSLIFKQELRTATLFPTESREKGQIRI